MSFSSSLHEAVYKHSVQTYEALKAAKPYLSATDLNHELFTLQMSKLEHSSSFWGDFQNIPGFQDLVLSMRRAAKEFLVGYGWSEESALRKASHPLGTYIYQIHTYIFDAYFFLFDYVFSAVQWYGYLCIRLSQCINHT